MWSPKTICQNDIVDATEQGKGQPQGIAPTGKTTVVCTYPESALTRSLRLPAHTHISICKLNAGNYFRPELNAVQSFYSDFIQDKRK